MSILREVEFANGTEMDAVLQLLRDCKHLVSSAQVHRLDSLIGSLSTPVVEPDTYPLEFQPDDMCVVIVAPEGTLGVGRTLTFDRNSREFFTDEPDVVDRWTRLVSAALLRDALDQLG